MSMRSGFTAVELTVTISIIALLSGMITPTVLPALRQGKVNGAVSGIVDVAREARRLAITAPVQPHGACYGVVVVSEGSEHYVALIKGAASDGVANERARVLLQDGAPLRKVALPAGVVIMAGAAALDGELAWYYHSGTGAVTTLGSGGFNPGLVEVGTATESLSDVWGLANPAVAAQLPSAWRYDVGAQLVAPSTDDEDHGLRVQTPDGKVAVAIAIYGTGLMTTDDL
ncbi:MAG: type II secretion system protein [Planctomycetota bacterium]|jgi:prepilin-type N-terminal cleavage/methylation domain-containing protein|nr:type II secretion system protein [Planctomycetota bacterium]